MRKSKLVKSLKNAVTLLGIGLNTKSHSMMPKMGCSAALFVFLRSRGTARVRILLALAYGNWSATIMCIVRRMKILRNPIVKKKLAKMNMTVKTASFAMRLSGSLTVQPHHLRVAMTFIPQEN